MVKTYKIQGVIKRMATQKQWPIAVCYHDDGRVEVQCARWGQEGFIRYSEWFTRDEMPESRVAMLAAAPAPKEDA